MENIKKIEISSDTVIVCRSYKEYVTVGKLLNVELPSIADWFPRYMQPLFICWDKKLSNWFLHKGPQEGPIVMGDDLMAQYEKNIQEAVANRVFEEGLRQHTSEQNEDKSEAVGGFCPNPCERFWYIDYLGKPLNDIWTATEAQKNMQKIGNCFYSENDALKAATRIRDIYNANLKV